MCLGGIGVFSSVSVYNGFGLRNKLRDGVFHDLQNEASFPAGFL